MKTKVHYYSFPNNSLTYDPAFVAMCDNLKALGRKKLKMGTLGPYNHPCGPGGKENWVREVEIDPKHLFGDQWNTCGDTNLRIFDWFERYEFEGRKVHRGHWTEITDEMQAARDNTFVCRYCGMHYGPLHKPIPDDHFCTACLGSDYLKEKDLPLTRLKAVSDKSNCEPLTQVEKDLLLPRYLERQIYGLKFKEESRAINQLAEVEEKYQKRIALATMEYEGKRWLLAHNFDLHGVMFHKSDEFFTFGWLSPLSIRLGDALVKFLAEFPCPYKIKMEVGENITKEVNLNGT